MPMNRTPVLTPKHIAFAICDAVCGGNVFVSGDGVFYNPAKGAEHVSGGQIPLKDRVTSQTPIGDFGPNLEFLE